MWQQRGRRREAGERQEERGRREAGGERQEERNNPMATRVRAYEGTWASGA